MPKQFLQSRPSWSPGGEQAAPHCWELPALSCCKVSLPTPQTNAHSSEPPCCQHLSHHFSECSSFLDSFSRQWIHYLTFQCFHFKERIKGNERHCLKISPTMWILLKVIGTSFMQSHHPQKKSPAFQPSSFIVING